MNRHNARMNTFALGQLNLEQTDHVLEIGFGGGLTLPTLLDATAFVAGLDRSHDVIAWAKRRFSDHINSGRADFRQGDVAALPFACSVFDKICTINTVYFWNSLESGFGEIYRVLKPRGRIAVGFLPKERMDRMGMPEDIFTTRSPQEIVGAMAKAGFKDVLVARPKPDTQWNVVVANR